MTTSSPKRRRRRFLQFSLRALLVFVLLVSIGMSWCAVKMEKARKQREAVEGIRKGGAWAIYDELGGQPPAPEWARALFGDDFFSDVVSVHVLTDLGDDLGDNEARHLKVLTNLECLFVSDATITDAGLANLEGLTKLQYLELDGTQITDAGLEHLRGLTKLVSLNLSGTKVTDAGLEHLETLASLRVLDLNGTQVTDAGLENLEGLSNLKWLDLSRTQVTPKGVKKLQEALPDCVIVYL